MPIQAGTKHRSESKSVLVELLKENPRITRADAAETLGVSESSVYRELKDLESKGIIIREGSRKNGYWVIT